MVFQVDVYGNVRQSACLLGQVCQMSHEIRDDRLDMTIVVIGTFLNIKTLKTFVLWFIPVNNFSVCWDGGTAP